MRSLAPYTAHFRAGMDALEFEKSPRIDQGRERSLTYAGPTPFNRRWVTNPNLRTSIEPPSHMTT